MTDTTAGEGVTDAMVRAACSITGDGFDVTKQAIAAALAAQPSAGAEPTRDQVLGVVRRYAAPAWCSVDRLTDEIVALYATPAQPDTGDVAALREALNEAQGLLIECQEALIGRDDVCIAEDGSDAIAVWRNKAAALSKPNAPGREG